VVNSPCQTSSAIQPPPPPPTPQPAPIPSPPIDPPVAPPINSIVFTPILITPINNEIIIQNNPDTGCPSDTPVGSGYSIFFDWTDSSSPNGISGYQLVVKRKSAPLLLIDTFVTVSEFDFLACSSFVTDFNLLDWEWTVQAEDNLGNLSQISETGLFQFEACRLPDGTLCVGLP